MSLRQRLPRSITPRDFKRLAEPVGCRFKQKHASDAWGVTHPSWGVKPLYLKQTGSVPRDLIIRVERLLG